VNHALDCLFRPRSIAVVGASRTRGTLGAEIFHNLVANGFAGPVYPVNPGAPVVQSARAYATVSEIPDPVDLAILVVPQKRVMPAIEDCGSKGVRGVVVISAGFGETGPVGRALQDELMERVRFYGMRLIGPNCLGILNTDPDVSMDATFAPTWPPHGGVSLSSQSGALGVAILDRARDLGIGISQFASIGNKADVSGNDLLEYWEADPATRVILMYMESFGNPRRFWQIARRVGRTKPIAVVKSGRTAAGARAASSHTGALAGLDVAVDALLGQAGVIRTDTIEQLFDVAILLANQPVAVGHRVGILTNAGGPGIMATDACESRGLQLPALAPHTEAALRALLPPEASLRNPVDMIASASAPTYEAALRLLIADPNVDSVIVLFVPPVVTEATAVAEAIRRGGAGSAKPVLTCFMGTHGVPPALSSLREGRFPSYAFPEAAAMALSRSVAYGRWLARAVGTVPALEDVSAPRARAAIGPGGGAPKGRWLAPDQVREVLAAYGLRAPRGIVARDEDAAARAAEGLERPVAVKLMSATITHKTDVGGVILGVRGGPAAANAFRTIRDRLTERGLEHEMSGVLVQEMFTTGVETFVGVTQDPVFGPLIGFGLGGVHVEVWKDVVFRVHPITDADARDMIDQVRGVKLLDGFRGAPAADRDALVDALMRVSRMLADLPELLEMDINPLLALGPGEGTVVVDARIRVRDLVA
jgi:acetyl coenzyme A synthetase (ADP forming)-like protein